MAFIVEDGSIIDGANALASLADVDHYHCDRADIRWTGTDALRQAAIIRATDWIEKRFGHRFVGCCVSSDQTLSWPRKGACLNGCKVIPSDVVPDKVKQAIAIYALRALSVTDFAPDPRTASELLDATLSTTGDGTAAQTGPITEKETVVGKLKTRTKFADSSTVATATSSSLVARFAEQAQANLRSIPEADLLLTGLVRGGVTPGAGVSFGWTARA